jgi:hypothetical protein
MDSYDLNDLKVKIENKTGFTAYESQAGEQLVFYGTSDKWDDFVKLAGDEFKTGTMGVLMDTNKSKLYSHWHKTWY